MGFSKQLRRDPSNLLPARQLQDIKPIGGPNPSGRVQPIGNNLAFNADFICDKLNTAEGCNNISGRGSSHVLTLHLILRCSQPPFEGIKIFIFILKAY